MNTHSPTDEALHPTAYSLRFGRSSLRSGLPPAGELGRSPKSPQFAGFSRFRGGEMANRIGELRSRIGALLKSLGEMRSRIGDLLESLGELANKVGEMANRQLYLPSRQGFLGVENARVMIFPLRKPKGAISNKRSLGTDDPL